MRNRATSEVSTYSSPDFSYSDIENISSEVEMVASPKPMATHIPQVEDGPEEPLIPALIGDDEHKPERETVKRKDSIFYCENVVLKVEDTLFCVPKNGLIDTGTYFDTLFKQVASTESATLKQGGSDDNPIILDGVSKEHFQDFLKLIYRFRGVSEPSTDEQWLGILHLATEWMFSDIREAALNRLEHLFISSSGPNSGISHNPVSALALCMKYKISQHLVHQLELIITSITPLNRTEMSDAGIDGGTIQLITEMREKWLCGKVWGGYTHAMLEKEQLGVFPIRASARQIIEDSLKRSAASFEWAELGPFEHNLDSLCLEEEKWLEIHVGCLRDQELQIVARLTKEREEEDERKRRVREEEENQRVREEAEALLVAEEEKKRRDATTHAAENAARLRRYTDALSVVKEEEERRVREEQEQMHAAEEREKLDRERERFEKEAKREEKRRLMEAKAAAKRIATSSGVVS